MAKTPLGKAIIAVYEQSTEKHQPRLMCIGCGCTEDRACRGGCFWVQPGICSSCEPRTAKLLLKSRHADAIVRTRAVNAGLLRAASFRVMSLAMLSWLGEESMAKIHVERLADDYVLRPFMTVRLLRTCWSFRFEYTPKAGKHHGMAYTYQYRLRRQRRT